MLSQELGCISCLKLKAQGLGLCQPTNLILQMKERREPIHMRMDDCCPSFFTVPVFRSRMRPGGERSTVVCELLPEIRVEMEGGEFSKALPRQVKPG